MPTLAIIVGPVPAVIGTTLVSAILAAIITQNGRANIDPPLVLKFTIAGMLGIPLGLIALSVLTAQQLTLLMAPVLLALVSLMAFNIRLPSGQYTQWTAGITSGALLGSTGMNGPPLVIVLHAMKMPPHPFRVTLQGIFCVQDLIAIIGFIIIGEFNTLAATIAAGGLVGMPLGWRVGERVFGTLKEATFRRLVLICLTLTALIAAFRAVF